MENKTGPFTIGGDRELREALTKRTGLRLYDDDCLDFDYLMATKAKDGFSGLQGCDNRLNAHFQLPDDYNAAVKALEVFFNQREFTIGRWYYAKCGSHEFLIRYLGIVDGSLLTSEKVVYHPVGGVSYYSERYPSDELDYIAVGSMAYDRLTRATDEQVGSLLGKVAEQKGYKRENAVICCLVHGSHVRVESPKEGFEYWDSDKLWVDMSLESESALIYSGGTWAELLGEDEVTEEVAPDPLRVAIEKLLEDTVERQKTLNNNIVDYKEAGDYADAMKAQIKARTLKLVEERLVEALA